MSVEVSSVNTADADAMGTRSNAPAAPGNSRSVAFALLSSMPATSSGVGGVATAVPAPTHLTFIASERKLGHAPGVRRYALRRVQASLGFLGSAEVTWSRATGFTITCRVVKKEAGWLAPWST